MTFYNNSSPGKKLAVQRFSNQGMLELKKWRGRTQTVLSAQSCPNGNLNKINRNFIYSWNTAESLEVLDIDAASVELSNSTKMDDKSDAE